MDVVQNVKGNVLSRGQRPSTMRDMANLMAPTIINLETGWFEFFHDRNGEESEWAKWLNIDLIHYPLSDLIAPTRGQVDDIHRLIKYGLARGNVHFHCLHGEDRTGYVAASWRMLEQKWAADDAIGEMRTMGFHMIPYFFWLPELRLLK